MMFAGITLGKRRSPTPGQAPLNILGTRLLTIGRRLARAKSMKRMFTSNMPSVALAGITAALLSIPLAAQTIRVDQPTEVARETEPRRFSEPQLAVHPGNPNYLLASVFVDSLSGTTAEIHAGKRCVTFASRDAGQTWTRHDFPHVDCGDPQVAILPDGQAVFLALAEVPGVVPKRNSWLFVFHSIDGGITWDDAPTIIGRPHDHPALAVDLGSGKRRGWIYVTSHHEPRDGNGQTAPTVMVVRSRDGGKSFDDPTNVRPNNLHNISEMPAGSPSDPMLDLLKVPALGKAIEFGIADI